jgi:primosomal protein N' (replication factor Y)
VEILDLRQHPPDRGGLLSPPLAQGIAAALAAGEQVILFLNRRGFSTLMLCRACGHVVRCPHCAVSMTYHRGRDRLVCHYCARTEAVPPRCPACRRPTLEGLGMGTEQVESLIVAQFPAARVARLDRDTADNGLERLLDKVHDREVDVLVGTQMVTKGHDFAGVTLVGVLQPDQGMHLPDFRAAERTFQLLEQVAGRAGRGERPGRVIVQTYSPNHPAIECLRTHDYEGFVQGELARRQEAQYPPFSRMIALRVDGPDETQVRAVATEAAGRARAAAARVGAQAARPPEPHRGGDGTLSGSHINSVGAQAARPPEPHRGGDGTLSGSHINSAVRVLGPAEAPLARLRGRTRWQVWLSGPDRASVAAVARAAGDIPLPRDVRLAIDVDPQSVL